MQRKWPMQGSGYWSPHRSGTVGRIAPLITQSALPAFRQVRISTKGMRKKNRFVKHKIEVFSAGCKVCKDAIEVVHRLAGSEHEVVVHDMHLPEIASRAAQHGVRSLPAVT